MRGKLIFPFLAGIARLDTEGMAADPDALGPLTSSYDPDFREPIITKTLTEPRVVNRKELPEIRLSVQVETNTFELLNQFSSGQSPGFKMSLIFHFRDLENLGLVDPVSGSALLRHGDRLAALYTKTGQLVQTIRNPPGLYATEVSPIGIGLGFQRNLLQIIFTDREQALL